VSRDIGTERADRRYVDPGPQEASAPAVRPRWLTVAALGRVAAAAAGLITLGRRLRRDLHDGPGPTPAVPRASGNDMKPLVDGVLAP
jgi:hypothetical protein